jgi:hypothetical protein
VYMREIVEKLTPLSSIALACVGVDDVIKLLVLFVVDD